MHDEKMGEYYNARAPEYEQIYYRDIPARRKEIDNEAARLEKLSTDKTVIDLACGTGYWTEVLARRAKSVLAVDASQQMIDQAGEKKFVAPVKLVQGDMFSAGEDQAYDLVSSGFWFSHQPKEDWQKFFDLLKRLVKPDGRIWLIENNPPAEGANQESIRTDEHGNNFKLRKLDDGREFVILKNYFEESELQEAFQSQFKIKRLTYGEYYWSVVLSA